VRGYHLPERNSSKLRSPAEGGLPLLVSLRGQQDSSASNQIPKHAVHRAFNGDESELTRSVLAELDEGRAKQVDGLLIPKIQFDEAPFFLLCPLLILSRIVAQVTGPMRQAMCFRRALSRGRWNRQRNGQRHDGVRSQRRERTHILLTVEGCAAYDH
jgi:hypothetical protein